MKSDYEIISIFSILKRNSFKMQLGSENYKNKYITHGLFGF